MKRMIAVLLAALLGLLCACAGEDGETIQIYRVLTLQSQENGELVRAETVALPDNADIIQATIEAFNAPAREADLKNPLPEYANLLHGTLEGGTLTLEAEPGYRLLTGIELAQANACVVLTFTELPDVDRVTIRCGDQVMCNAMSPDNLVLTDISTSD